MFRDVPHKHIYKENSNFISYKYQHARRYNDVIIILLQQQIIILLINKKIPLNTNYCYADAV
jgi:hypothetical protein